MNAFINILAWLLVSAFGLIFFIVAVFFAGEIWRAWRKHRRDRDVDRGPGSVDVHEIV